jgi:hypothetical protein
LHLPEPNVGDVSGDEENGRQRGDNNDNDDEADDDVLGGSQADYYGKTRESAEGQEKPAQPLGAINIAELERKYVISDVTLFIKSCCVLVVVILLFFLHSFLSTYSPLRVQCVWCVRVVCVRPKVQHQDRRGAYGRVTSQRQQ